MLYLNINNSKHGLKYFNCGTRFDWYILINKKKNKSTYIIDETKREYEINTSKYEWLPNSNFHLFEKITTLNKNNQIKILCDFSYSRLDNKIVSKNQNDEFKYKIVYLTPKNGTRFMFSNTNKKGHFRIAKVIIGETGMENAINDYKGEYGMTQDSFGIIIENQEEGDKIIKCILTKQFIDFIKNSCSWSSFRIDWRLFTYFKKDFYKYFMN